MKELSPLKQLLQTLPQEGRVEWIGVRPERNVPINELAEVRVSIENGLDGDRFSGGAGSKRQVTLIQAEHLSAIASLLHRPEVHPSLLRRNIVVSGINLLALKDKTFQVGSTHLRYTGLCHPCNKMEKNLGPGGYNAVRGHGGITATVVGEGIVRVGDTLTFRSTQK